MGDFYLVISTIIAVCAVLAGLGLIFNILLDPIKNNQDRFDAELKEIKAGQVKLDRRIDKLESKIDQLIATKT